MVSIEKEHSRVKNRLRDDQLTELNSRVAEANHLREQGKYESAIEICSDALQMGGKVFGESSISLLPTYFCLADSYLGLNKLKKAEEFLIAASWNILQNQSDQEQKSSEGSMDRSFQASHSSPSNIADFQSRLHKLFGKLFAAQHRYEDAINKLTQNIYIESQSGGPENINLTSSYYLMGEIFSQMKRSTEANAFYAKIVEMWANKLNYFEEMIRKGDTDFMVDIDEIQIENALMTLRKILSHYEQEFGDHHQLVGDCKYVIGLIFKFSGNNGICLDYMRKALETYSYTLGDHHQRTINTMSLVNDLEEVMQSPSKGGMSGVLA